MRTTPIFKHKYPTIPSIRYKYRTTDVPSMRTTTYVSHKTTNVAMVTKARTSTQCPSKHKYPTYSATSKITYTRTTKTSSITPTHRTSSERSFQTYIQPSHTTSAYTISPSAISFSTIETTATQTTAVETTTQKKRVGGEIFNPLGTLSIDDAEDDEDK